MMLTQKPKSIPTIVVQKWTDGAHVHGAKLVRIQGTLQHAVLDQIRGANAASSAKA